MMEGFMRRDRSLRIVLALAAGIALVLATQGVSFAAAGDPDPGFGTAGAASVSVSPLNDAGNVVRRSDGSLVTLASGGTDVSFAGVSKTGAPLTVHSVTVPGASQVNIVDAKLGPNDGVVGAGYAYMNSGPDAFLVARFKANGNPDGSFSKDGVAVIKFPHHDSYAYGVAVLPNGKIVAVGEVDGHSRSDTAIIRLTTDGKLDGGFGQSGQEELISPDGVHGYDAPYRVIVQSDGKLLMAGWAQLQNTNYKTMVIRTSPNGRPDATFSGDGFSYVKTDPDEYAYGVAMDGSKIVLAVHESTDNAGFRRLMANGKPDGTFGNHGSVSLVLSHQWNAGDVAIADHHKIVSNYGSGPNTAIAVRVNENGTLDSGWAVGGEAVGAQSISGRGILVQPNGAVVVVGIQGGNTVVFERFTAS
jgi:uncharacterized delta-60 repeat protein